jgi:hypothetical protein
MALRERNIKGGSRTTIRAPRSSRPPRKRPLVSQKRRKVGGLIRLKWHQGKGVTPKEAQEHEENIKKFKTTREKTINNTT